MVRRAFGVTGHHILSRGTVGGWLLACPVLTVSVLTFTVKFLGPADGPALPVCGLGPAALSRVLLASREGEQRRLGERLGLGPAEKLDTGITSPFCGRVEEMAGGSCQHWHASSPLGSHSFLGPFVQFCPGKGGARTLAFQLGV